MASLRQEAQNVLDTARDGIGWIVIWKTGRSWHSWEIWPDILQDNALVLDFEDDDWEQLQDILREDPQAMIVNGFYDNLGDTEDVTRESLTAALRWQYELGHNLLADHVSF